MKRRLEEVQDIDLSRISSVEAIISAMGSAGGFSGRSLADGLSIMREMISVDGCVRFLAFPAALVATGVRGVITEMLRRKYFDAVITTCGTLDHDVARSFGRYYKGEFFLDDIEVERSGYHRLGNVLVPKRFYGPLIEKKMQNLLKRFYSSGGRRISSSHLSSLLGGMIQDEHSILHWTSRNSIPVIVPGITDGAVGSQIWLFSERHSDFSLDLMEDEKVLSDLTFRAKESGALIIGGGISKHHTIWWNQFKGGLDYAVYITTAQEFDGSLSGAVTREAISWGKISPKAKHVTINGEATMILPFLVAALPRKP